MISRERQDVEKETTTGGIAAPPHGVTLTSSLPFRDRGSGNKPRRTTNQNNLRSLQPSRHRSQPNGQQVKIQARTQGRTQGMEMATRAIQGIARTTAMAGTTTRRLTVHQLNNFLRNFRNLVNGVRSRVLEPVAADAVLGSDAATMAKSAIQSEFHIPYTAGNSIALRPMPTHIELIRAAAASIVATLQSQIDASEIYRGEINRMTLQELRQDVVSFRRYAENTEGYIDSLPDDKRREYDRLSKTVFALADKPGGLDRDIQSEHKQQLKHLYEELLLALFNDDGKLTTRNERLHHIYHGSRRTTNQ